MATAGVVPYQTGLPRELPLKVEDSNGIRALAVLFATIFDVRQAAVQGTLTPQMLEMVLRRFPGGTDRVGEMTAMQLHPTQGPVDHFSAIPAPDHAAYPVEASLDPGRATMGSRFENMRGNAGWKPSTALLMLVSAYLNRLLHGLSTTDPYGHITTTGPLAPVQGGWSDYFGGGGDAVIAAAAGFYGGRVTAILPPGAPMPMVRMTAMAAPRVFDENGRPIEFVLSGDGQLKMITSPPQVPWPADEGFMWIAERCKPGSGIFRLRTRAGAGKHTSVNRSRAPFMPHEMREAVQRTLGNLTIGQAYGAGVMDMSMLQTIFSAYFPPTAVPTAAQLRVFFETEVAALWSMPLVSGANHDFLQAVVVTSVNVRTQPALLIQPERNFLAIQGMEAYANSATPQGVMTVFGVSGTMFVDPRGVGQVPGAFLARADEDPNRYAFPYWMVGPAPQNGQPFTNAALKPASRARNVAANLQHTERFRDQRTDAISAPVLQALQATPAANRALITVPSPSTAGGDGGSARSAASRTPVPPVAELFEEFAYRYVMADGGYHIDSVAAYKAARKVLKNGSPVYAAPSVDGQSYGMPPSGFALTV